MKILTVDTSGSCASIALSDGRTLLGETLLNEARCHTGRLLDAATALLQSAKLSTADLDAFAVCLGPGAFTGVRVGIALVKGLAIAAGKPAVGFSSLAMLAQNLPCCAHQVAPLFDARKNEVYAGLYRVGETPQALLADAVLPPANFLAQITEPTVFLGDGAVRYRELISSTLGDLAILAPWPSHLPRASCGAVLALEEALAGRFTPLELLNPTYLRLSEAEYAKMQRESADGSLQ